MTAISSKEDILKLGEPSAELQQVLKQFPALADTSARYKKEEINQLRGQIAQATTRVEPPPDHIKEKDAFISGRDGFKIPVRIYSPAGTSNGGSPLVVNYHGGGWIMGDLQTSAGLCRSFVTASDAVVVDIDYRLAPENPFPTPINDCWDALRWVAENASSLNANPERGFIVSGVSAGANLAAVVAQYARDQKLSPALTGTYLSALPAIARDNVPAEFKDRWLSYEQNKSAPILNRPLYEFILDCYKPDGTAWEFSPILNPNGFANLPPTYFEVCGMDPLRDDGLIYESVLKQNNVKTKLNVYAGLPHCWWGMLPQLQASQQHEIDSIAGFKWLLGIEK